MKRRLLPLMLAVLLLLSLAPAGATAAGSDYTSDPALAGALDDILAGKLDMYTDQRCTTPASAPVGTRSVPLGRTYYVKSADGTVYSGTSCYIYANAVYATLFGDVPYHGQDVGWRRSYTVARDLESASYGVFSRLGVGFGALLRTTSNRDGSYNGNYGHSLIILNFDEAGLTYLEGNGDGKGLIRVTRRSWDAFNDSNVGGRGYRISFIVQPKSVAKASDYVGYIRRIRTYGGRFADVPEGAWFAGEVAAAYETGLVDGRAPDRFEPEGHVTAAEAVTLAARFLSRYYDDRWSFASAGEWYEGYYDYLARWGVDTSFAAPDEEATRGELARLLARVLPKEAGGDSAGTVFSDVPDRYREAVRTLTGCGVVKGDGGLFRPDDPVTRAEAAAMLARMADRSLRAVSR